MRERPRFRASLGEIVGAWLGVWTPRRDAYIPPVPAKRLALGALLLVAILVGAAVLIAHGKGVGNERDRRIQAAHIAQIRAQIAREQIPRHARFAAAAQTRPQIKRALEHSITADSQLRFRRGALDARVTHTTCIPFVRPSVAHPPEPPPGARTGGYECLGVTSSVGPTPSTRGGDFGFPFWARVDFRHGSAVWCKVNPRPGEMGIGGDVFVPLAPECDLLGRRSR